MKLTYEMRESIAVAIGRVWDEVLVRDVHAFEAGYRMGQRDMRERAAKRCETARCRGVYPEERAHNDVCDNLAEAIRNLSVEDANG